MAEATWSINVDFLANIKGSKGRFRTVLLLRPDIFNSVVTQNSANKIRDNAVFLDWRTTYPDYRYSQIFFLTDKLLSAQQEVNLELGNAWDYYFPWKSKSTRENRDVDPSFLGFLRLSYSRPRDLVSMVQFMQEVYKEKRKKDKMFSESLFTSDGFRNKYSEYLLRSIRDQLSFYYTEKDYDNFVNFFPYLNGKAEFGYDQYQEAYNTYTQELEKNKTNKPQFMDTADNFLQFLYDTNIICYIEDTEVEPLFRWCYRERNQSNMSPKLRTRKRYRIHYGLFKALNVGFKTIR